VKVRSPMVVGIALLMSPYATAWNYNLRGSIATRSGAMNIETPTCCVHPELKPMGLTDFESSRALHR
jgi:hypothetical protein